MLGSRSCIVGMFLVHEVGEVRSEMENVLVIISDILFVCFKL